MSRHGANLDLYVRPCRDMGTLLKTLQDEASAISQHGNDRPSYSFYFWPIYGSFSKDYKFYTCNNH